MEATRPMPNVLVPPWACSRLCATATAANVDDGAAWRSGSGKRDFNEERHVPFRSRSLGQVRCSNGNGSATVRLAIYAFLIVVSILAAAWHLHMALSSAKETERMLEARCRDALSRAGNNHSLASSADRDPIHHAPIRIAGGTCMLGAAQLLKQMSQVGRKSISTTTSATMRQEQHAQYMSQADAFQPSGQQEKARTLVHLATSSFPRSWSALSDPHLRHWNSASHSDSIVMGDILNVTGGVTIGESGYYFVYSQVGYILASQDAGNTASFTDHKLMRQRAADREPESRSDPHLLARSRKTRCWSTKSNISLSSSYIGAVFLLKKGDLLTVDVDRAIFVWYKAELTFIGAYFLSS